MTLQKHNDFSSSISLLKATILTGIALLLIKFTAYYLTGSNAILSDALESIVNVAAGLISLLAIYIASVPKDVNHPYGHGKAEFLSAGFEGGMIVLAACFIIGKAVYNLFVPNILHQMPLGIALTALSGLVNFIMGVLLTRKGKKNHSAALVASGEHLKTDTYTTIGLLVGLLAIWLTKLHWLDQIIAIAFAILILRTGYKIVRGALSGIMDETDLELISHLAEVLRKNRKENWIDIHNLRVIKYGSSLHIDCHVTMPWYLNLQEAHEEITKIDELINAHFPNNIEFFIHEDPCIPESCRICAKQQCPVRLNPFEGTTEWTIENLLRNKKHGIT